MGHYMKCYKLAPTNIILLDASYFIPSESQEWREFLHCFLCHPGMPLLTLPEDGSHRCAIHGKGAGIMLKSSSIYHSTTALVNHLRVAEVPLNTFSSTFELVVAVQTTRGLIDLFNGALNCIDCAPAALIQWTQYTDSMGDAERLEMSRSAETLDNSAAERLEMSASCIDNSAAKLEHLWCKEVEYGVGIWSQSGIWRRNMVSGWNMVLEYGIRVEYGVAIWC
ncbi:hypothetical protein B0H14DRAFT_2583756 [Mycena olivaceomarginata]|nr:hypothetical protein B0H14DRAFT_2583756 [Mycena olivaceomarginata]